VVAKAKAECHAQKCFFGILQSMIDAHSHIHVRQFDADRDEVIKRAQAAGITKMINVGFDIEGIFQAVALAKKHDFIYAAVGIHPHLASEWNEDSEEKIKKVVKMEEKIVAIGETGLDFYKNFQPVDLQEKAFRGQIKIAQKFDLPIIIHCRDAYKDVFRILEEEGMKRVLLHCFTGKMEEAVYALKMGYFLAFTGVITYPSAGDLREVAAQTPLGRILIETDCPFLAPKSKRGQRNEPSFIPETYKEVAKIKKMSDADFIAAISQNASTFFKL